MVYTISPIAGPQGLHLPAPGLAYITVSGVSNRALITWSGGNFNVPYSLETAGNTLEVAGPWHDGALIYIFGNPDPILLKSPNGGISTIDIKPAEGDPLKPVLPLHGRTDDLLVVTASEACKYYNYDTWYNHGVAPIVPQCGMRSRYGGVQNLLGQKQAGETYKIAFSPDLGKSWEAMDAGLPDMKVTSIAGLEGGGDIPPLPKIETCVGLVQAWIGYHWRSSYPGIWFYDYDTVEEPPEWRRFGHYYFRKAMRGQRIMSWTAYNCQVIGDATYFALEIVFYSPWPIYMGTTATLRPSLWYKTASTLEELTGAPIPVTDISVKYPAAVDSFDLGYGNYMVRYTVGLNVTDSEPFMAYSLMTMHQYLREATQGGISNGDFECLTDGYTARPRGWMGETSYDSLDFWTLKGEFNHHYGRVYEGHQLDLGGHLGTCELPSTGFQYDLWNALGGYEGLDMDNHHLLDLGLGIIHKVI